MNPYVLRKLPEHGGEQLAAVYRCAQIAHVLREDRVEIVQQLEAARGRDQRALFRLPYLVTDLAIQGVPHRSCLPLQRKEHGHLVGSRCQFGEHLTAVAKDDEVETQAFREICRVRQQHLRCSVARGENAAVVDVWQRAQRAPEQPAAHFDEAQTARTAPFESTAR